MIYVADSKWCPTDANPFTPDGSYGEKWSAFIYDRDIEYFSNRYPETKLYVLRFSPDIDKMFLRLFDFLDYELSYGRNIILKLCKGMDAEEVLKRFKGSSHQVTYRESDGRYMVHSTTKASWECIQKDKALLSPNKLKEHHKVVNEIGMRPMLEPADYSDYIMLDVPNGCGELVVNSRNLGYVCPDPEISYTPGVRLYFDIRKMFADKIIIRDGLHPIKVKNRLPLDRYLRAVITANDFPPDIQWTPTLFTQRANELFYSNGGDKRV